METVRIYGQDEDYFADVTSKETETYKILMVIYKKELWGYMHFCHIETE